MAAAAPDGAIHTGSDSIKENEKNEWAKEVCKMMMPKIEKLVKDLTSRIDALNIDKGELLKEIDEKSKELEEKEKLLTKLRAARASNQEETKKNKKRVEQLNTEIETLKVQLKSKDVKLRKIEKELEEERKNKKDATEAELIALRKELEEVKAVDESERKEYDRMIGERLTLQCKQRIKKK